MLCIHTHRIDQAFNWKWCFSFLFLFCFLTFCEKKKKETSFMEKMVKWDRGNWMRDSLDGANLSFEKDRGCGFSWSQRSYRCSFCKKEFKSAQALGGHMNVHRRDRARMRLSSPSRDPPSPKPGPNPNLKHNPKPNPSFSSTKSLPYSYMGCHSLLSTSASPEAQRVPATKHSRQDYDTLCRGGDGLKKNKGKMDEVASMGRRKDVRVWKGNTHVRLDLNLGLVQAQKEEDLDLELRLGYP